MTTRWFPITLWNSSSTVNAGARSQSPSHPLAEETRQDASNSIPADVLTQEGGGRKASQSPTRSPENDSPTTSFTTDVQQAEKSTAEDHHPNVDALVTVPPPQSLFAGHRRSLERANSPEYLTDMFLETPDPSQSLQSDLGEEEAVFSRKRQRLRYGLGALIDKHSEVLAARVNAEESRTRLKNKRHALKGLDILYMGNLETLVSEDDCVSRVPMFKNDFERLQASRSEIGVLEEDYEEEENRLIQLEAELKSIESKIYKKLAESSPVQHAELSENESDEGWPHQALSESALAEWDVPADHPPEVRAYLSQLGDVNMLKERLMDKDTEYVQVTEEKALRLEIGLAPEKDSEDFLTSFEVEREALAAQLKEAEDLLAGMAANLDEHEILPTRGNLFVDTGRQSEGPSREHSLFGKDDYYDEAVVKRDRLDTEHVLAAAEVLLFRENDLQLVYKNLPVDGDGENIDKASYVNSWQLHRLRTSTREVARLIQAQKEENLRLNIEHLKANVLETWMHDPTMQSFDFAHFAVGMNDLSMARRSGVSRHCSRASDSQLPTRRMNEHLLQRRLSIGYAETTR